MTSHTETSKTTSLAVQVLVAVAEIVVIRLKQIARFYRHRRQAAELAHFDDRMLADIGLTRGDVRDAFSGPLWHDPTAVLVSRANERRAALRRTTFGLPTTHSASPSIAPDGEAGCKRACATT